ncbi:hypothetical protein GCM10020367_05400 [Streptomyces sannanensis]|uniref:Barstar (barnase inhibitor) domain-containing protein n=1 Tax=Streptomyces sannanensis TaxID=285536 RepID=A0ABP6S504_9ACTN
MLDGTQIRTLEDFWRVIGEAINGPGGYFGRNLDAFADCLSGGFGAPDEDAYLVEWRDHEVSREHPRAHGTGSNIQAEPNPREPCAIAAARDGEISTAARPAGALRPQCRLRTSSERSPEYLRDEWLS